MANVSLPISNEISNPDIPRAACEDNRIAEWIADIRHYDALLENSYPRDITEMPIDDIVAAIPAHLWHAAWEWRERDYHLTMQTSVIATRIIDMLEDAETVEQVAHTEALLLRWMDVALIDRPETGWVAHRASWRRDDILKGMDYREYLKSEHWLNTRKEALARAKSHCQVCNSPTRLEVHHRTYERRGAELPEDLIVLCHTCHETFHKNGRLAR